MQWRLHFIQTQLEREIRKCGSKVVTGRLSRVWRVLGDDEGDVLGGRRFARSGGVGGRTISRYVDMLEKLL
ncbi:MAG: hypothetical protein GY935_22000 [Gammaproteobacteria bacterium]|nr:hypothetical protein [Gammaproteobacteria bacterium]